MKYLLASLLLASHFAFASSNGGGVFLDPHIAVGTTTPGYKLDVNGDINIVSSGNLRFGGTSVCTSAGCTSSSDIRLKENIQPLENSLDKILKLQGVEYDYINKQQFTDQHQVGVIAQDVEKVFPEVVRTDDKTGLKAVAYDHLIAPVIEAIKTLYTRILGIERQIASDSQAKDQKIENLENQNKALQQRLDDQQKELEAIKRKLGL